MGNNLLESGIVSEVILDFQYKECLEVATGYANGEAEEEIKAPQINAQTELDYRERARTTT